MFKIGINSLCLTGLQLFNECFRTQPEANWPGPPAAQLEYGFVQSFDFLKYAVFP